MFLLCNVHDRDYRVLYPGIQDVIFDISDTQLGNVKNFAWTSILQGAIVCIVRSSRKVSTFYRVEAKNKTNVGDESGGFQHVITGLVIGKLPQERDMSSWLNQHDVASQYLPANKFSIGFNVADLGDALDSVKLRTANGLRTIGEL